MKKNKNTLDSHRRYQCCLGKTRTLTNGTRIRCATITPQGRISKVTKVLPWKDSNSHKRNQNPVCYHYTTRQFTIFFCIVERPELSRCLSMAEPESSVLPLHHKAVYYFFCIVERSELSRCLSMAEPESGVLPLHHKTE